MDEYEPDMKHIQAVTLTSPVEHLQVFNPLFRSFLSPQTLWNKNATLKTQHEIVDLNRVRETGPSPAYHDRPVHIKYSPLLDPLRYMIGKYDDQPEMEKQVCFADDYPVHPTKYKDLNNASYVDAFFCFLSSRLLHGYGLQNAIDFYGCFAGVQQDFSIDILDDYEYLGDYSGFLRKMKSGEVVCPEFNLLQKLHSIGGGSQNNSRGVKHRICLEDAPVDDLLLAEIISLEDDAHKETTTQESREEMVLEYEKESADNDDDDDDDDDDNYTDWDDDEDNLLIHSEKGSKDSDDSEQDDSEQDDSEEDDSEGSDSTGSSGSEEDNSGDEEGDEEEEKMMALIKNFPVQLICLEKCKGTLDAVFCQEDINSPVCMAYAFQIVATLAAYQKAYSMTHNDLHTNNIVYCSTKQKYLYYRLFGKSYRVPTHGKIMKIIDFGRSVYRFGDRKMMSDGFSPTGDAHTQYNTEPYYNSRQPRIEENPSFDLCRLGCSIYDFVFEDRKKIPPVEKMDAFQKMIHRWCLDDQGKNILYKKNGQERFPNFKLYKMIARSVHQHTPENQMSDFSEFLYEGNPNGTDPWINIDEIPALYVLG